MDNSRPDRGDLPSPLAGEGGPQGRDEGVAAEGAVAPRPLHSRPLSRRGRGESGNRAPRVERRPWLSPMNQRRLDNFRGTKTAPGRCAYSWFCSSASLFAEFIANDRPLIASYKGEILFRSVRLSGGQIRRVRGARGFSRLRSSPTK